MLNCLTVPKIFNGGIFRDFRNAMLQKIDKIEGGPFSAKEKMQKKFHSPKTVELVHVRHFGGVKNHVLRTPCKGTRNTGKSAPCTKRGPFRVTLTKY